MTTPLQPTGYRESRYERPTQKWVCGWTAEGNPCAMGPDRRGRCPAVAESRCSPRREGDRYSCTRPAVFGGPCEQGPLPDGSCCRPQPTHPLCQPRLSLRAKRVRTVLACASLTLGLLVVLLAGPWRLSFVSPGKLVAAHEGINSRDGSGTNCSVCHSVAQVGPAGWVKAALGGGPGRAEPMGCLDCHFRMDGATERVLLAHNEPQLGGEVACAACHQEHRGKGSHLTQMHNTRCQACHAVKFDSFADGHPEFRPIARSRGGIRFDHTTHQQSHFGEADFGCDRCHVPDADRKTIRLAPFERSCAGCHAQGKTDHHGQGIKSKHTALIELPYMEFDEPEVYWPEEAAQGEALPPLMLLLLAGADEALPALRSLADEDVDWIPEEWWPDDEALKVVLATAIKRVVHELATGDESALLRRTSTVFGAAPGDADVQALVEQLSSSTFATLAYQRGWLPALADDLAGRETEQAGEIPDWNAGDQAQGWFVDSGRAVVGYRSTGHSDPFLTSWIEALVGRASADDETEPAADDAAAFRRGLRSRILRQATSRGFFYTACLRCHTVDEGAEGYRVNWVGAGRETRAHGYSKFEHGPHLALLEDDANCGACHRLAAESGISPHVKEQCVGCHVPGRANADCLNCHVYHFLRP